VLLLTSSLCFPKSNVLSTVFVLNCFHTLSFSVSCNSFACLPAVAGHSYENCRCVPTISILELNLEICPGQSLLLFIFHQSPVTIYQSQVAHPLSQTEQAGAPPLCI